MCVCVDVCGFTIATVFVTIEEDKEDAGVGELLSTQQIDVLHAKVEGQFDDGAILHVSGDVSHQSQVLDQTTGLHNAQTKPQSSN